MNNWFNIKRFWLVLRHEFVSAWIELALFAALILLDYLLPESMSIIGFIVSVGLPIFMLVLNSRLLANMRKNTDRLGFLVLPASNAEKFYARLILYWIVPVLVYELYVLGANTVSIQGDEKLGRILFASTMLIESLIMVLGGTIFRRLVIILMALVELVLIVAVVYLIDNYMEAADFMFVIEYVKDESNNLNTDNCAKLASMFVAAFAVLSVGLARIIFSRKRIGRLLVNIEE